MDQAPTHQIIIDADDNVVASLRKNSSMTGCRNNNSNNSHSINTNSNRNPSTTTNNN